MNNKTETNPYATIIIHHSDGTQEVQDLKFLKGCYIPMPKDSDNKSVIKVATIEIGGASLVERSAVDMSLSKEIDAASVLSQILMDDNVRVVAPPF